MISYYAHNGDPYQVSCGCVIYRQQGPDVEIALLRNLDELKNVESAYSLPKGTLDLGETLEQAALREAKEETGFDLELIAYLGGNNLKLFNKYTQSDWDRILHYFLATQKTEKISSLQLDASENYEVVWCEANEAYNLLQGDYKKQHIFVERALNYLGKNNAHVSA